MKKWYVALFFIQIARATFPFVKDRLAKNKTLAFLLFAISFSIIIFMIFFEV